MVFLFLPFHILFLGDETRILRCMLRRLSALRLTACSSKYEDIYQQVLSLNGEALPIEFDTPQAARLAQIGFSSKKSRARKLGLKASTRGTTVYLFKESA